MTKEEVVELIKSLGVKKRFKPYRADEEKEIWLLMTNRPARIEGGFLVGVEIWFEPASKAFRVWTSQRKKAGAVAREHGLKARLMDGEAEVLVPAVLADDLLPGFGAKVKREIGPERMEALKVRMAAMRQDSKF